MSFYENNHIFTLNILFYLINNILQSYNQNIFFFCDRKKIYIENKPIICLLKYQFIRLLSKFLYPKFSNISKKQSDSQVKVFKNQRQQINGCLSCTKHSYVPIFRKRLYWRLFREIYFSKISQFVIIRIMNLNSAELRRVYIKKYLSMTNTTQTDNSLHNQKERKYSQIQKSEQSKYLRNTYDPAYDTRQKQMIYNQKLQELELGNKKKQAYIFHDASSNIYVRKYLQNKNQEKPDNTIKAQTIKSENDIKQANLNMKLKALDELQQLREQRINRLYKKASLNLEISNYEEKTQFGKRDYYSPRANKDVFQKNIKNQQIDKRIETKNSHEDIINPQHSGHIDIKKKYADVFKNYIPKAKDLSRKVINLTDFEEKTNKSQDFSKKINGRQLTTSRQKIISIDDFKLNKKLGEGKFGIVHRAVHKVTKTLYAIKIVPKKVIKQQSLLKQFILELKIQAYSNHNNILKLYSFFADSQNIYLILEYMQQGTLFKLIKCKQKLDQNQTANCIRQIASAIQYLHELNIAHRDLKPQNIVMTNNICKLCDFGWSTICNQRRKTFCGTLEYAAPQLLQGAQYDMSIDLWCLGVLTYELLVGFSPFHNASRIEIFRKIINVHKSTVQYPKNLSKNAVSFIQYLLKKDPKQRMTICDIMNHPFLKNI